MTEQEWLTCTDPTPMLEFVRDRIHDPHDRKCWCFVAACQRRSFPALAFCTTIEGAQRTRNRVELLEKVVAGTADVAEMDSFYSQLTFADAWGQALVCSMNAAETVVSGMLNTRRFANRTAERRSAAREAATITTRQVELAAQSVLLRCIFGNPFRPVTIDPRWLTSTVLDLTTAIENGQPFDRLPILADALQDAGCDNDEIIAHCRSAGAHARGCWVVDLVLGKE
jgi:hypothetical protein